MRPVRFWMKVCAFFFIGGLLSLVLVSADHFLSLGIWNGHYPPKTVNGDGIAEYKTYGECILLLGITVVIAGTLGTFLMGRLRPREMEVAVLMEMLRQQGREEARESDQSGEG